MFDVGFSEILMVALVALLVLGPDKLPKAARIAGFWVGRSRSLISQVKEELKHELHAEEIRQLMKQQLEAEELRETLSESERVISDIGSAMEGKSESNPEQSHGKSS